MTRRARVVASSPTLGAWLAADVISLFGSQVSSLAVPWFVLTSTGSAALTGTVGAVQLTTLVTSRFLAGPLIDRVGPTRTAVTCDVLSAAMIALVPALWTLGHLPIAALIGIVAAAGALRGPADSSKQVLVAPVAEATGQPLERMTGLAGTTERLASTIGLAVGGMVVAAVGGPLALILTACALASGAGLIRLVVAPAVRGRQGAITGAGIPAPAGGAAGYLRDLLTGLRFIVRTPVLLGLTTIPAITNMLDSAWSEVLMPAWIVHHGEGAQVLGYLFATFSLAAVAGSALASALSEHLPRAIVYFTGFTLAGAPRFIALAWHTDLAWLVAALVVGGFGAGFVNPVISAVRFERTPEPLRGRVLSTCGAMNLSLMPLGSLLGGLLADHVGLATTVIVLGLAYLAATTLPAARPSWRDLRRREEPGSAGPILAASALR